MTYVTAVLPSFYFFFFFNDTATTEIYTLSLHDALPISFPAAVRSEDADDLAALDPERDRFERDRKSTRLNSSHMSISYAVFCLKKKTTISSRSRKNRQRPRRTTACSLHRKAAYSRPRIT